MAEDINKVILIGRLTREAELVYTNSGLAYSRISIASNKRKKQGDEWVDSVSFFDCTLWGKRAEGLNPYLTKGTQVAIEGSLEQDRWEKDGQKRSKVGINISNLELLSSKDNNSGQQHGNNPQPSQASNTPKQTLTPPSSNRDEEDIPF